ncbi:MULTISPECIES: alcohol dehydrogenase catalytic domain-containing protein [unclassified Pseudoclavibacter]|uniref:alcohol dehydrogenase catalytic domain-containing protein n=1 Tax=unclassified Pseudoclavibacter TaxID=2615177 RepID=UPI000CE800FF|nr:MULTISPECIES: alcohol dehydrogenase catalytic domain-containing protein [unclassified Pseudoclavibacter]MBF4460897.1 alcohol dehydrogenase catalytic domain-containing protein [Pseudoclavibacter sp. VKM Ac-2867]MBF4550857.1 alcohol dehydrogenase catalytic domain-containing protein [Pseudoclavibacter sp. VKM Ac-2888]PPF78649.1 alcohol dehydrogenase [Pseudoclavibacter sp. Z016]PPG05889.1 alcohol dehydrogenase [Pseudoclavibacter sp. RFBI5]VXB89064.1 Alcohol dehydrogenase [Pseudoclavibacter sp. 
MNIQGAVLEEIGLPRPYSESKPLKVVELELDDPGPDEVLIRIRAAGLCHSDLSVVDGNRVRPTPMLLGHEASGIVEKVGSNVTDLEIGEQVTTVFLPRCGECDNCKTDGKLPCTPGSVANNAGYLVGEHFRLHRDGKDIFHHVGVSGFATHAVLNRQSVVPIGHDVPPEIAAVLGCAVLTGGGAVINAGKPQDGDTVMIVGLGGVGMAALLTAVSLEKGKVIGVDANPEKLTRALELGASEVYTPAELAENGVKAPIVIEAAGHPRAFETAVAATGVGGTTVTVGLPSPDARSSIAPLGLTGEARTIVGSYLGSAVPARDIPVYAQLWRDGKLPVEELISGRIRLSEINDSLDKLADGQAVRQVIIFDE